MQKTNVRGSLARHYAKKYGVVLTSDSSSDDEKKHKKGYGYGHHEKHHHDHHGSRRSEGTDSDITSYVVDECDPSDKGCKDGRPDRVPREDYLPSDSSDSSSSIDGPSEGTSLSSESGGNGTSSNSENDSSSAESTGTESDVP